ncbi:hypothetical protein FRX31_006115 [Thalictrum thalictroides]|uniref:Uncharacterized protein n=1 Tax=Thalictrum thalictroides TaxID=46969 RepID=A0A7J6X3F2_THATH|nr:hypothetical protein FRX31_006115 [Thalictrum thalictroides]
MKNLYPKNKGKVYPTPSSPSSSSSNTDSALSVLKFLPTTILALASILSLEDREVLAYLITRSLKTTNPNPFEEKKKCKKPITSCHHHKFDCGCFDCYTSYWYRWDSSPNRELIHQVIEAFEDHLTNGELSKKKKSSSNNRGKKRDKVFDKNPTNNKLVNNTEKADEKEEQQEKEMLVLPVVLELEMVEENCVLQESEVFLADVVDCEEGGSPGKVTGSWIQSEESLQVHKGLARKVLPDVMGLFNSRIWSLWSTNI